MRGYAHFLGRKIFTDPWRDPPVPWGSQTRILRLFARYGPHMGVKNECLYSRTMIVVCIVTVGFERGFMEL
jgi:hypothetical protein